MFGGAAGFICQISFDEGNKRHMIFTDKTWQARMAKEDWQLAAELKPHGAAPWGKILNPKAALTDSSSPPVRASLVQNDFLMRSLGRPHRDQVVTTRPAELTTLQAIDLSNGDIVADYLRRGAQSLINEGKTTEDLIEWLYRYALSREPTSQERKVLRDVVGDGHDKRAIEDLLWMIIMLPEFQIVR